MSICNNSICPAIFLPTCRLRGGRIFFYKELLQMKTIIKLGVIMVMTLITQFADAQDAAPSGEAPQPGTRQLPPVVVTANPIIDQVKVDSFSSTSAIVTERQLHDQNAFDLATALRRTPG